MVRLFRFLRNIGLLLASGHRMLLLTYLKLKLVRGKNRIQLLNFKLNFLNFDIVVSLFEDLFIDNEYFVSLNNQAPIIIDVGANIGLATVYFKYLYPQAKILAFEPDPDSFRILKKNVSENHFRDIKLKNCAVASKAGRQKFYFDKDNRGALLMSLDKNRLFNSSPRMVKTVKLSSHIDRPVDLLKLDVEGAERKIIEELSASKKMSFVKRMIIEYHHHIDATKDEFSRILGLMEENGFGYQMTTKLKPPVVNRQYQDILIYGYKKKQTD